MPRARTASPGAAPPFPRAGAVALWAGIFVVTWLLLLQRLVVIRDEAWMLWIATRVARGETLYRDVYDVTTPLPAWLAAATVRVVGSQMAAIRALSAAVFATEVVLGVSVTRRTGLHRVGQVILVGVLLAVATPSLAFVSLYSALAICFGLATLRATVWWCDAVGAGGTVDVAGDGGGDGGGDGARARAAAWTVGLLGAGAFWSKPNVGVFVALAVGVVVLVATSGRRWSDRWPHLVRIAAGALALSAACVAAIVVTGAWSAFAGQVFASKGEYLRLGFGYLPAIEHRIRSLVTGATPFELRRVVGIAVQASPLVLLGAAVVGAVRARRAAPALRVATAGFAGAGVCALLPRPGLNHIVGVMPLVLVGAVAAWALGNRSDGAPRVAARVATVAVGVLAVLGLVAVVAPAVSPPHAGRSSRSAAHFRGTPVADRQLASSARFARELRRRDIREVFIVRKDAGFLYLRAGVTDPLPYDIVERSDLGADDEAGVIRLLEHGAADWVCVRKPGSGGTVERDLVPRRLEAWIRTHFTFAGELARCDLYEAPAAGRA